MRLPIRKPGKYTHLKSDAHLTEEKYQELENKLKKLKIIRPALAAEVKRLAEMGDFSENAAYQIAKGRLRGINQKMLDLEDQLRRAVIIKRPKHADTAQLGSEVTVEVAGKQKTFLILGSAETDPRSGVISYNSPLGSALIGRGAGDRIKLKLADREVEYRIIKII